MMRQLKVLFIDDTEDDVLMVKRSLRMAGFELAAAGRAWTPESVRAAFVEPWDVVLSDWAMPDGFTGLAAFQIMRELGIDLPYIIVSGTISEEIAVDALKAGVHDFISKGRLARLVPAIERELREVATRRREREADQEIARQRSELERSERLLRAVIDSVPYAIIVVDRDAHILTHNAAAVDMLGPATATLDEWFEPFEIYRPDMLTRTPPSDNALRLALAGETIDGREGYVRDNRDGRDFWVRVSALPLRDTTGIHGAFAILRDVTRDRAQQQQLLISDRMASIGMLAAGVAHELNNPLAAVLANVELASAVIGELEHVGPQHQELQEMLDDARAAGERVRHIVRDLKIFSRHEDTELGAVDIRKMLESTVRMAWNQIRHRAQLEQSYAETPLVKGSESRLGQVFLNLIVNAAQAIPEGNAAANRICIATQVTDGGIRVEISDTGSGMSVETQQKLFTPFFTTKPQGEGTGLGLAISHRIVTGLGGHIEIDSELGRGTTFFVYLPPADDRAPVRSKSSTLPAVTRRSRVLVIDDEPMITTVVRRLLPDHHVETFNDARDALALLQGGVQFDLILTDLMMPQMTGMALYEQLQRLDPSLAERVVFMTGDAFTVAARTFLDQVQNPRIEKPFDRRALRALLERAR